MNTVLLAIIISFAAVPSAVQLIIRVIACGCDVKTRWSIILAYYGVLLGCIVCIACLLHVGFTEGDTVVILLQSGFWLLLLSSPGVGLWLIVDAVLRKERHGHRHCVQCGYDLTGNVSGRCSECGASVEKPTEPAMRVATSRRR